jgi:hypothetical protein
MASSLSSHGVDQSQHTMEQLPPAFDLMHARNVLPQSHHDIEHAGMHKSAKPPATLPQLGSQPEHADSTGSAPAQPLTEAIASPKSAQSATTPLDKTAQTIERVKLSPVSPVYPATPEPSVTTAQPTVQEPAARKPAQAIAAAISQLVPQKSAASTAAATIKPVQSSATPAKAATTMAPQSSTPLPTNKHEDNHEEKHEDKHDKQDDTKHHDLTAAHAHSHHQQQHGQISKVG